MNKLIEKAKAHVFTDKLHSAFLGSIICSMKISLDTTIPTLATNGKSILINPEFFEKISEKQRVSELVHEAWHIGRLHFLRKKTRDFKIWNIACDYVINNAMVKAGYTIDDTWLVDKEYEGMSEEEVYEILIKDCKETKSCRLDMQETTDDPYEQTSIVIRAMQMAKVAGQSGNLSGSIKEFLNTYLNPKLPWNVLLQRYLREMIRQDYSWKKPNRRYEDMYLPSIDTSEGKLTNINVYFDVSGSVTTQQCNRVFSEVKYIKNTFQPEKINLVQFDYKIQKEETYTEFDEFNSLNVSGRGGTSLECVKKHIEETSPTIAIIFSDLICYPMEQPKINTSIIWIVLDTKKNPKFGTTIHFTEPT